MNKKPGVLNSSLLYVTKLLNIVAEICKIGATSSALFLAD